MVGIELLKLKSKEAHYLFMYLINGFAIFVAINGALAKFALDVNSTFELRRTLTVAGLVICFLAFFCCWPAIKIRSHIKSYIMNCNGEYGIQFMPSALIAVKFILFVGLSFTALTTAGWIWVIASS